VHAGLPVGEGEKIGLNIWPRKYFGYVDDSDEDGEEAVVARQGWSGKWKD
jgi:prolyl 4-hydroxylase